MSNKLAKVLLICALVVCIPMFIAGTVLAVYYSRNASFDVAVYIDNAGRQYGDTATPTLTTDARSITENTEEVQYRLYTITNCHVEDISISHESTGYDFVGWYNGTYEDYTKALSLGEEIHYITNNATLTAKTADYENLTAVFNVIVYNVDFSYSDPDYVPEEPTEPTDPENPGEIVESPVLTDPIPDDGITDYTFEYNQELPKLENTENYLFMGWEIEGDASETLYNRANFPTETREVVLNAVWGDKDTYTYTINYVDEKGAPLTSSTLVYISDEDIARYNAESFVSADTYQDRYEGYTLSWVIGEDENQKVVTELTSDMFVSVEGVPQPITITLNKELINRTINVLSSENITYSGNSTFVLNVENQDTIFVDLFAEANWKHELYPLSWKFVGVQVNGEEFSTSDNLLTYIKENNLTTVDISGIMAPKFTSLSVDSLEFSSGIGLVYQSNGNDLAAYRETYYVDTINNYNLTDCLYSGSNNGTSEDTAVGLFYDFDFSAETTYYLDEDRTTPIAPTYFEVTINGEKINVPNLNMTIYDFVELLVENMDEVPSAGTLNIENITLCFEEI